MAVSNAAWKIAEWAGSAVVSKLISTGFTYLLDHVLPTDSKAELKRLQAALPQITAVMGIAEALKMKHPDASQWVEQFREAVEASEDVLDKLEYKKMEDMVKDRDEAGGSASSSKKRKSCTINDDTLERLKEAVTMLDQAANGVDNLLHTATLYGIQNLSESRQEVGKALSRETTSFVVERELFGRKVEKHKIIDWLKRPTDVRLSSFGIVGVGGQGKTTLVQFAYQEICGSKYFDETIWVCVSTNFSVEDTTRKMLCELGENNINNKPLNTLQENLKEKTHLKKILLVLDDIWDDEKRSDWDKLFAPLRFVQEGSKILFTTRMKSVADLLANVINTEHESLSLQGLGEQELQLLFQSYAFRGFNLDNHRDLQGIGDQILKMLRGSPLAAKVIGCLLNTSMDHQYWTRVLNRGSLFNLGQAKDVVEVLKLSYYHLPVNLQVCFRFCSIFPQDHQFDKDDLIKMWICSGFVRQKSSQEERPEDIGEDYFNLLLRKSFFETWKGKTLKGEKRYVMHDLVHELAQNVSYGECCRIEPNDKSITIPSTVRHVYVHEHEMEKISHLENLRSLVITSDGKSFVLRNNLIKKSLRLLKIRGSTYSGPRNSEMPKEISYLEHLRYLSVEGSQPYYVTNEKFKYLLLDLVYKLYHLQVLEIPGDNEDTINSAIETTGMTNLLRLRYMRLPKEIMQTIHEVHKLTSLQELTFFVGQESGQRINELGTLKNLRHLSIENIENIEDHIEAKSANLLEKNNLMSLSLKWTSKSNPIHPEKIIDNLQPPSILMELTINNYSGERSPNWMEDSPPLSLRVLEISGASSLKSLPATMARLTALERVDILNGCLLEELPELPVSLRKLAITGASSLKSLPATMVKLTVLKKLQIWDASLLEELPELPVSLRELNIDGASSLKSLPATMARLTALKSLEILDADLLEELPELPISLRELDINASSLKSLPATMARLTALKSLAIWNADLLEELPELPVSLRVLNINGASSLKSWPATMARLTDLEWVEISNADLLQKLLELLPSLKYKIIESHGG